MNSDVYVVALVKGPERYVLLYDAGHEQECLWTIRRWARQPGLSLTSSDADMLAQQIAHQRDEREARIES